MIYKLLRDLNPREFARYMKEHYRFFHVYNGLSYIGTGHYIFGYYIYVEELGEKRRIIGYCDTANRGCILFVK